MDDSFWKGKCFFLLVQCILIAFQLNNIISQFDVKAKVVRYHITI